MAQLECFCGDTMRASCALDESTGAGVTLFTILFGFVLMYCAICGIDGEESDSDDAQPDGMYT